MAWSLDRIAALAPCGQYSPVRIGSLSDDPGIRLIGAQGTTMSTDGLVAFDHFR